MSTIAAVLAGLGIFYVGMHLLTEHMKLLSKRGVRERIARLTRHPLLGVFWGGMMTLVTQSTTATTYILIGLLRSGMLAVRQVLPIIIGSNMLAGLLLFVLVYNIHAAVLLLIGIAGMAYTNDRARSLRNVAGVALGVAMLFLGLDLMRDALAPLAAQPWFREGVVSVHGAYALAFLGGAALSVFAQSELAVILLTIAFQSAGFIGLPETMMLVYGANLGASARSVFLSSALAGLSKQVAMYRASFGFVGAALLLPLFVVEMFGDIPLLGALTEAMTSNPAMQVAVVSVLFNVIPSLLLLPLLRPSERWLARFWPESAEEEASRPRYLLAHAAEDTLTALDLLEKEQSRLVGILAQSFALLREGGERSRLPGFRASFAALAQAIRESAGDIPTRHMLAADEYERLDLLLKLQHALETADAEIAGLHEALEALRESSFGASFVRTVVEGIDTILLTLLEAATHRDDTDLLVLAAMTDDTGNGMKAVRDAYLEEAAGLSPAHRLELLAASQHCERLIWLFGQMGGAIDALRKG